MTEILFEHKYENSEWKGYTKFLPEVTAVRIGVKPVMRIPINPGFSYERFRELCKKIGVLTGLSDYKIKEPYTKDDILPLDSEGDRLMYVSMDEALIRKAKKLELNDDEKYGELMGYPSCCIDYYKRIMEKKPDQELFKYIQSGRKLSWYNNYLLRFNSHYYLHAYFVCSFDCRESIKKGKEVLKGIREIDPVYAEKIEYHLKLPILFDDSRNGGIIYNWDKLKAAVFDGKSAKNKIRYKGHFSLWQGHYFPEFAKGDMIEVKQDKIYIFKDDVLIQEIPLQNKSGGFLFRFE